MSNMIRSIARNQVRQEFGNKAMRSIWRKLTHIEKRGHLNKIRGPWAGPVRDKK